VNYKILLILKIEAHIYTRCTTGGGRMTDAIEEFCRALKDRDFEKAAELVEECAKLLVERVRATPLRELGELIERSWDDEVDKALLRSEILVKNVPPLSNTLAQLVQEYDRSEAEKLRKLMKALINFFRYYSGKRD